MYKAEKTDETSYNANLFNSVFRNDGDFLQVGSSILHDIRLNRTTSGAVVGRDIYPHVGLNEPDVSFTKNREFNAKPNGSVYNRAHEMVYQMGPSSFINHDDKLYVYTPSTKLDIIDWRFNEIEATYFLDNKYDYQKIENTRFLYGVGYPRVKIINLEKPEEILVNYIPVSNARSYTAHNISKDGGKIILLAENQCKIFDVKNEKIYDITPYSKGGSPYYYIKSSFSNDGKYVIILPHVYEQITNILHIYNTDTGQLHATLEQPPKVFNAMFRQDDKIITVYEHGQIGFWDFEKAELIGHTKLRAY